MGRKKEQLLFYSFIISQPVIDLATGLIVRFGGGSLTPGSIIRAGLLVVIIPYIWRKQRKKPVMNVVLGLAFATIAVTAGLSMVLKSPFYLQQEAVFYMKALYFVGSVLFIRLYIADPLLSWIQVRRAIIIVSYFVGGSYLIALLTNSSFASYPHGEIGHSGWFFSANELSVIAIALFASAATLAQHRRTYATYGALLLLALMGMFIGTKTAYLGIAILLVVHAAQLVFTCRTRLFAQKDVLASLVLMFGYLLVLPVVPMTENSVQNAGLSQTDGPIENIHNETKALTNVLSSRETYVEAIFTDFQSAPLIRQLFGLGYAGDYSGDPKMIEMDFFDLLFSFGVIGALLLLTPLLILMWRIVTNGYIHRQSLVLLTGFSLTIGVAAVAGHVFFAPSVMSYIIIAGALLQPKMVARPRQDSDL